MNNLKLKTIPEYEALAIRQTLLAAYWRAEDFPIMFPLDPSNSSIAPPKHDVDSSRRIITSFLVGVEINDCEHTAIMKCLNFMFQEIQQDYVNGCELLHGESFVRREYAIDYTREYELAMLRWVDKDFKPVWGTAKKIEVNLKEFAEYEDGLELFRKELASTYMNTPNLTDVVIEFGQKRFTFCGCAAEYNGLLEFIDFVKSEQ